MSDYNDNLSVNEESTSYSDNLLFDREMEEALIGSILINPDILMDVLPFMTAEDFYIKRNAHIWEAFVHLTENDHYIDPLTVKETLESRGVLEEIGGIEYLIQLSNRVPSSLHALSYARTINELRTRRRLRDAATEIAKLAYKKDVLLDKVLDDAGRELSEVSQDRHKRDLVPIEIIARDFFERVTIASAEKGDVGGLKTGLKGLDEVLDGLHPSDLIIVAGRPGMGKTGFMIGIAKHIGMALRRSVAMFSLEMSAEQLLQRMIAQETGIDSQKLRTGKFTEQEAQLLPESIVSFEDVNIFIDDTPGITPLQMSAKCRRLKDEHSLDLVVVDYLQLMSGDGRNENRVQEVSYISRQLKIMARDLGVPVLAAAQLSRAIEQRQDKQPLLSDLRESGSLEQDADVVLFISRPFKDDKENPYQDLAKITVAKHRNGPVHPGIEMSFIERLAQFKDKVYLPKG